MNTPQPGSKLTRSSSITIDGCERPFLSSSKEATACIFKPSVTALNCKEQTESTSGTSRLNSSKHPQAPEDAKPGVNEWQERGDGVRTVSTPSWNTQSSALQPGKKEVHLKQAHVYCCMKLCDVKHADQFRTGKPSSSVQMCGIDASPPLKISPRL